MSSLASILSVARGAMQAQQVAMQTTSQNIANASVAGYSVQRVELAANHPETLTYGIVGTGVSVAQISRSRDALLDTQYRTASTSTSAYTATSDILSRVEGVFGEPATDGLGTAIDALWDSWGDLANDPSSNVARTAVQARGNALATMFHEVSSQLDDLDANNRSELGTNVSSVNKLLDKVATLNPAIVSSEANGQSANDLRDERDRVLDQLSTLISARTVERGDGSVGIYAAGRLIVDHDSVHHIATSGATSVAVTIEGDTDPIVNIGGTVGADIAAINVEMPKVRDGLDALAGGIVREVNAIHSSGTTYSGTPPVAAAAGNFFTQNGAAGSGDVAQTARGISLDASLSNLSKIAASGGTSTGPGDNSVASALSALRESAVTVYDAGGAPVANTTLGSYFRQVMTDLGLASSQATDLATGQKLVMTQADSRREALSGVATDEELVQLIKQQQAYAAAARLVSAVDEMSKTLLAIGQ